MKKLFVFLIFLFLTINLVYALDCQYTEEKMSSESTNVFYHGTLKLNYSVLEAKEFVEGYTRLYCYYPQFKVYNNMPSQEINVTVSYIFNGQRQEKDVSIAPEGYSNIQIDACGQSGLDTNSVQYKINSPTFLEAKREKISITDCLKCPKDSETICLNEGMPCESNIQCGSNFCIKGICSDSELCYNNDCKCASDEIQCSDNKRCVKKTIIPLDVKPECNKPLECVTGYIQPDTGLCAKSPAQLQEEEDQKLREELTQKEKERKFRIIAFVILTGIIIVGIVAILHLKKKHKHGIEKAKQQTERAKQETIEKEKEKAIESEIEKRKTIREEQEKEKERRRTLQTEIDSIDHNRAVIKEEIKAGKKKIEELNKLWAKKSTEYKEKIKNSEGKIKRLYEAEFKTQEDANKEKKDRLEGKEKELNLKEEEIAEKEIDIESRWDRLRPFPDEQVGNRLVIYNPYLSGYKCFYHKDVPLEKYEWKWLVHRWVWTRNHSRSPKQGYHIHHIDHNKYNNELNNLEEIEGTEHYEKHRFWVK